MPTYNFQQGETEHRISLGLPANLQQQFAAAPRSYTYTGVLPKDWKLHYFLMFLRHGADKAPLLDLLAALRQAGQPRDNEALALQAIAFVQTGIAYDWQTAYQIAGGQIRYPSETLLSGKGVCADKTILLAALLQQLGFGLAIFTWERANHMALGLKVPTGYGSFGTAYAMVETTGPTAIGQVPERYAGGIRLDGKPEVVELPGGTGIFQGIVAQRKQEAELERQYGSSYLRMTPAQQALQREMQPLQAEIEALSKQLKGCSGTLPPARFAECQALQSRHSAKVAAYNALVAKFNAA
ncbi:MAG TPA: transglutaminase-like domain-containing protein [Bacteroidia bacterium]|nr:transglutaminase-like domain-containing protein [Bacteroidia bacterium]